jgi:limonene 1,2-monooxygenase
VSDRRPLRFGAFIAPFQPPSGNPTLQLRRNVDLAIHLDHLGFDEIWYGEHHSGGLEIIPAPDVMIAAAAEHAQRIHFGTGVLSLPFHHPLIAVDRICQLDHQTRGRVIFGTGPGVLATDSHMMGLDPTAQRGMQAESLEAIVPLLAGETVSMRTDWFTLEDARLHLRPYRPEGIEVVAASTMSPSGSLLAAKHGISLMSLAAGDEKGFAALDTNWEIYERESLALGHLPNRENWRLVSCVFLADTVAEARAAISRHALEMTEYIERTYVTSLIPEPSAEVAIDHWIEHGLPGFGRLVLGTPADAIAHIEALQEKTEGFGTYLINAHDMSSWEARKRSFELFALEVMPHFQGSNRGREESMAFQRENAEWLKAGFADAVKKAKSDYEKRQEQEGNPV